MVLKSEQRRLYALLPQEARCFVRVCDDDSALWVSDLPRKYEAIEDVADKLLNAGFEVQLDDNSRLWYIDWAWEAWIGVAGAQSCEMPQFPEHDAWHGTYALCRFLLSHPAEMEEGHLPFLRRVLKSMEQPQNKMQHSIRKLHEEAAVQLRN